ncbi:hypothetical protein ACH9L7_07005 [Haloferax sp. S1W]|uniref:DUF7287 family protein n=1 Tax=Haloferax sp. S1W TaxID=3377110 RepID=UPI0037C631CE
MRRRDRSSGRERQRTRAQTTIDYAIGVGIFLLAVAWVVGTIPQVVQPFDDTQDRPLVANRAADQLTGGMLSESGERTVLSAECVDGFFDNATPPADCQYRTGTLGEAVGVGDRYEVNVTLLEGGTAVETRGDPVPSSGRVITARRTVLLDGTVHQLLVRVW